MKKTTPLIAAAALLLAACEPAVDTAEKFRNALPKEEAVTVATYQSEAPASTAATAPGVAKGDSLLFQSEYALMSYRLAVTLNGGVAWTLGLVRFVTLFPPTTCDDAACTWGPWVDDDGLNRWKLHVEQQGDAYAWALSAQPGSDAAAPYVDVVAGTAYPDDRDRGSGTFTIDFDAQDALDHGSIYEKKDFGEVVIDYDNTSDVSIDAVFTGAHDEETGDLMDAVYAFRDAASGGELQVAFENLDTTENVSLRTRWSAGGAGRADAHYNGPDGAGGRVDYYASECWAGHAQDFEEVYDSKYPWVGEASACSPYSQPLYADVVLP
jgi:hypothetical protein